MVVQKVPNPQEMKSTPTAKQEPKLKKQKYSNKTSQKPTNSDNSNQMEESEVFYTFERRWPRTRIFFEIYH